MTKAPAHAAVSAITGTFQSSAGDGNQKRFSARGLVQGEGAAGTTGSAVLVSSTTPAARACRDEQRGRARRRHAEPAPAH